MKSNSEEYLAELDDSIKELGRRGFQQEVTKGFRDNGWMNVYHTHDSRHSPKGFPDLVIPATDGPMRVGKHNGFAHLIVIELKVGDNRPTFDQVDWLIAFRGTGALTFVLWPRHRDVLKDLYAGHYTERVYRRLHIYDKHTREAT